MLNFESRSLEVKFNSVVYKINFPTVTEIQNFVAESKEKNDFDATLNLLERLGLSKDISGTMEVGHLEAIIGELTKKK